MVVKTFSLEEANDLIPELQKVMEDVFQLTEKADGLSKDIKNLHNIWGDQIMESENPDYGYYNVLSNKRHQYLVETQKSIEKINKFGCILKDVKLGLIDFLHRKGEDLVYLCWMYGEKSIKFWHGLNEGMTGRKPAGELLNV